MSARLFGTDGMRGRFGEPPLVEATVTALAASVGRFLGRSGAPRRVVMGGDTRESTPEIARWLAAGLEAEGVEVRFAGVLPTPGIGWLTREEGAGAGLAVSASHNPHPDNGIKLLSPQGSKWSDADEAEIERGADEPAAPRRAAREVEADPELARRYLDHLAGTLPGGSGSAGDRPLSGLAVVLDAGNGAASPYAGELFERLGAEVTLLSVSPDGRNVNQGCGSTAPQAMAAQAAAAGAHLGAAFDGDADRTILADERGEVRDGDAILYLWARDLAARGELLPRKIVATTMSNLGLERALARDGIEIVRCPVGDRYVAEAMRRDGILLGGEQSGHVIDGRLTATGDGLLTALQIAGIVARAGLPLSELLAGFVRYPQILENVRVHRKADFATLPRVQQAVRRVEDELGQDGRLVLRYSGTEPLARIMLEGPDQAGIEAMAREIAAALEADLA
jgi:phosphoglucosamine mutase